ncbi:SMI1/KNR4 family protein [Flavisolibacter tropicus]|uniref:Knr4/Smi1-like domain-containing protein n=1 Tax=Flavisolibacter tropicus TaxID=1492898 RepID=A0A172TSK0_9BACT|nr:SMI1/KNR4 family protein [Flavisolibacter tropicus]ANE49958.1 hypothetical protein SY85_05045 [Flavisolibacter tropicus]
MQKDLKERVDHLLSGLEKDEPMQELEFEGIIKSFEFRFPDSYIEVMKGFNGGEGEVGEDSWLCFFPITELRQVNIDYELLMSDIPDYFLFGKDAADTGYAFHKINSTFHSFGLMSNFDTDPIAFLGNDFVAFLESLYNYRYEE